MPADYESTPSGVLVPLDYLETSATAPKPEDRWMEDARRRLFPSEVESTLVNALSGDLLDQQRLFATMIDTWPRLAANIRTLRDAAKSAPFTVHAATIDGEEPTTEAQDDANLVEQALWGARPDVTRLEKSVEDLFATLAESDMTGHEVCEILWRRNEEGQIVPRAYRNVSAGWWGYAPSSYSLEVKTDRLMLRPGGPRSRDLVDFTPHKYIVSIQPGHSGHPSVSASLRSLAKYWIAAVYGCEWLLTYAQLFNVPFRWANYPANNPAAKAAVASMLANIGTAGWAAFPEGVTLNLKESVKAAGDLPSKLLMEVADVACDIVVLGQTLTSDTGSKGGGSFALGKVHAGVRRDRLESVCRSIASTLSLQLVPSILELNHGKPRSMPEIRCDMPEPKDAKAEAERDKVLKEMGMPLPIDWLYERHGVPQPEEGQAVLGGPSATPPPQDPKLQELATKAAAIRAAAAGKKITEEQFTSELADIYEAILTHSMALGYDRLKLEETQPTQP